MTTPEPAAPGGAAAPAPPADPMAQTLALIQPWVDFVPPRQRRLGLFICLALLVHVAAFFFIRVDASRTEFPHQAHTHVTMESPAASLDASTTAAFLDLLSDPRLFLLPILPPSPSFPVGAPLDPAEIQPTLGNGQLPPAAPAATFPLVREAAPSLAEQAEAAMLPPRQPFTYAAPPAAPAPGTGSEWSGPLAARTPAGLAALPVPVSDTDLPPTKLRVSVDPAGTVRDVLLDQTSQQPDLDRQAILAARKVRFAPVDRPGLEWGRLTIFWHPTAPPREVVVPTPPTP